MAHGGDPSSAHAVVGTLFVGVAPVRLAGDLAPSCTAFPLPGAQSWYHPEVEPVPPKFQAADPCGNRAAPQSSPVRWFLLFRVACGRSQAPPRDSPRPPLVFQYGLDSPSHAPDAALPRTERNTR
jgi:hypothetical protein